jgi:hypothetical protein
MKYTCIQQVKHFYFASMKIITQKEPELAPPGAGLPWLELQIAKRMIRWQLGRSSRASAEALISLQKSQILQMARSLDPEFGRQRVLIKRLPGMEDSSRYWSLFMTLDHLQIVNGLIAEVIVLLVRGEAPEHVVSTAEVKPSPEAGMEVLGLFETSCQNLNLAAETSDDLQTKRTYEHPWFGPMTAAGWYFMAGFHMRLHQKQIQAILRAYPKNLR